MRAVSYASYLHPHVLSTNANTYPLFFFSQEQFIYLFLFIYFGVSWTQGTYPLPYYMNLTDQMIPNIILPSKFGTGIL